MFLGYFCNSAVSRHAKTGVIFRVFIVTYNMAAATLNINNDVIVTLSILWTCLLYTSDAADE